MTLINLFWVFPVMKFSKKLSADKKKGKEVQGSQEGLNLKESWKS